jgi:hypothetical protein
MNRLPTRSSILLCLAISVALGSAYAAPVRLVMLKVDGLPRRLVDRGLQEINPETGKTALPWIQRVFAEHGTWVRNFYVRGLSISVPSWSMLDTGRHLAIRGNAEYDRYSGEVYDYLNFFPFYVNYARSRRVDMRSVEVLDEAGIPLLLDRFGYTERHQGFQLYQRGVRWTTLQNSFINRFSSRSPGELFNEWMTGFEATHMVAEQLERELVEKLGDERILYLDFFTGDYDHTSHLTNEERDQLNELEDLDALVGRIWNAIQESPLADRTVLVLVSDHGMNTEPGTFSQGYSLIDLFCSSAGGGHHVMTNRHTMEGYKLKGLDPFVSQVVTPSRESFYLKDQAEKYPTAIMDLDGNERASIYLRDSDLNVIHILLEQLGQHKLPKKMRSAAADAILELIGKRREEWSSVLSDLNEELKALQREIDRQNEKVKSLPAKWTDADRDAGRDQEARREIIRLESWQKEELGYTQYAQALALLLRLDRARLLSSRLKVEAMIPPRAMGNANSLYKLQNYVAGPGPAGLIVRSDGSLDLEQSFRRVNYFSLLESIRVRNNVQVNVGPKPVDFIATRIQREALIPALPYEDRPDQDGIWLYGDSTHQGLLLSRLDAMGILRLRYLPVSRLHQNESGLLKFELREWGDELPLRIWEDPELRTGPNGRDAWLRGWHTESEWMNAVHRCTYSNAVIGLHEQFRRFAYAETPAAKTRDEALLRRLEERRRRLAEAEMVVFAGNHWNFNVRGFNPGGNHGSLLRVSTLSTLLLAGAGVPQGLQIEKPYDSLSLVPTLLKLIGRESSPNEAPFPGPVIEELFRPGSGP